MSHYADYVRERVGDAIIENEHGFATFRYLDEKTVYIVDIYTVPEARQTGRASVIADEVIGLAKKRGCTRMVGTLSMKPMPSDSGLRAMLGYGMRLVSAGPEFLMFEKDI